MKRPINDEIIRRYGIRTGQLDHTEHVKRRVPTTVLNQLKISNPKLCQTHSSEDFLQKMHFLIFNSAPGFPLALVAFYSFGSVVFIICRPNLRYVSSNGVGTHVNIFWSYKHVNPTKFPSSTHKFDNSFESPLQWCAIKLTIAVLLSIQKQQKHQSSGFLWENKASKASVCSFYMAMCHGYQTDTSRWRPTTSLCT